MKPGVIGAQAKLQNPGLRPDFQLPFAAFPPEPRSNPGQNAAMHIKSIALHKIDMIGVFTLGCLMKGIPVTRSA
jgi:hypothetical protein